MNKIHSNFDSVIYEISYSSKEKIKQRTGILYGRLVKFIKDMASGFVRNRILIAQAIVIGVIAIVILRKVFATVKEGNKNNDTTKPALKQDPKSAELEKKAQTKAELQNPIEVQKHPDSPPIFVPSFPERIYSDFQESLHTKMLNVPFDPNLFDLGSEGANQLAIAQIIQTLAFPIYKEPMPQDSSYYDSITHKTIHFAQQADKEFQEVLQNIKNKQLPARIIHGTMHCVRTALWTQLLARVYESLGRDKLEHSILLGTAGAFHDTARENEGTDYWDEDSSEVLKILFKRIEGNDTQYENYIHAIKEKDPKEGKFSTDIQRIIHDADCLEIMRALWCQKSGFKKQYLCFYHFNKKQESFCDSLIDEIGDFIEITENLKLRTHLEHHSKDFYGDIVRLLFAMKKDDKPKFPMITELLKNDMVDLLNSSDENITQDLLNILQNE